MCTNCTYKKTSKHYFQAFTSFTFSLMKLLWVLLSYDEVNNFQERHAFILLSVLLVIDYDAYASPLPALWPLFPVYLITIQLCVWSVYCLFLRKPRMTFITVGTRRLLIICLARRVLRSLALSTLRVRCSPAWWSVLVMRAWGKEWHWQSSILYSECKAAGHSAYGTFKDLTIRI